VADNIQDPNDPNDVRRRQNPEDPRHGSTPDQPDEPRPEGTTGREQTMPRRDEDVPGQKRDQDLRRPDDRRDAGEVEGDTATDS
jgi:hypothetical protein